MNDENRQIYIPADLHEQLRRFSEKKGIPLADFIVDSLENAMHLEGQYERIRETEFLAQNISEKRADSHERGFKYGVLAAFLNQQGDLGVGVRLGKKTELLQKKAPFKVVTGGQLGLFD